MKLLGRTGQTLRNYLFCPVEEVHGVHGLNTVRFHLCWVLYFASSLLFMMDPFFHHYGEFVYKQGIVTIFLAWIIATAFNWDMMLFGKPEGANLLLHFLMIAPLALFIARVTSVSTESALHVSLLGKCTNELKTIAKETIGIGFDFFPKWLTDMFSNWKISLLVVMSLFSLSLKKKSWKLAAIIMLLLIPLLTVFQETDGHIWWLFLGTACLVWGLIIQYCRYDRLAYFERVARRLERARELDEHLAHVILQAMTDMADNDSLSEANFFQLVKSEYMRACTLGNAFSEAEIKLIASEIMKKMIYEYHLVTLRGTSSGISYVAEPMLYENGNMLSSIAVLPRIILAVVFALAWIISPIDLIPDAVPVIGVMDDVFVTVFSGLVVKNSIEKS